MADADKIARLQAALDAYEPGTGHFDRTHEEALAPVRKRALGLLDQRARSRAELRERLLKAEFEPQLVDEVLDDLAGSGLINDSQFAHEWVRQRAARQNKQRAGRKPPHGPHQNRVEMVRSKFCSSS